MNVCKCDRCGAYVDKQFIPEVRGKFVPTEMRDNANDFRKQICYNCYADLQTFFNPKEESKEE